jgi:basic membrane protein A
MDASPATHICCGEMMQLLFLGRKTIRAITTGLALFIIIAALYMPDKAGPVVEDNKAGKKLKVAFICYGSTEESTWNAAHEAGREYLEEKLPFVAATVLQCVTEGRDAEQIMERLAKEGYGLIFATSPAFFRSTVKIAGKYPSVVFMSCSREEGGKNVGTYWGEIYEPVYLAGMTAGLISKKGVIGCVAADETPAVVKGINAFTLGARAANPNARVKVVWAGGKHHPSSGRLADGSLFDAGCDIIAQYQDTFDCRLVAGESKGYGNDHGFDVDKKIPESVLTSAVWNWGPFFEKIAVSVYGRTWQPSHYSGTIENGTADIAPFGPVVNKKAAAEVLKLKDRIAGGEFNIFAGPILDREGKLMVRPGSVLKESGAGGMLWFVQGVEGRINAGRF